ncbi:sigma 54-interacting transcriptional regulator [Dehalobacter sp. DCM]|uniref:sigma-54-dependent Fis family transcriptional regulator n=1 Tax=Dehalobacter sp. DCM TaxID=2907827 RepID=UPI0030821251|nr:sigma 54-interacting transcriptional regulator [Dehalobacter sp. DCM]
MGRQPMTKERWEGIIQCKKDLVEGKIKDHTACSYLEPEIAASWMMSFNAGLNPFQPIKGHPLSPDSIFESRIRNSMLIEHTKPLFSTFTHWADNSEYTLSLDDKDGIALIRDGNRDYPLGLQNKMGISVDENDIGTNAHMLVRRLKRPIQLQGPEHYSTEYEDYIVSAAPILDDNNDIIAILSLIQTLPPNPWDTHFQSICSHTLSLLSVMATALENKLMLQKSRDRQEIINKNLRIAHSQLNITLDLLDEGIVVVDHTGMITSINKEGLSILNIIAFKSGIYNICSFLTKSNEVIPLLTSGNPVDFEDTLKKEEPPYIINLLPVINQTTAEVEGAVLRLHHAHKMNMKAANRAGTKASITFSDIIGDSKQFKNTVALAKQLAFSPENILLIGESGTGKELFAQAVHNTYCPHGPFIALNCGALPRNLIESELFGYESGSFTGANRSGRPGKIELAHGGTLFLDEMGDMPYEIQSVLLRVLEDKRVTRIGGQSSRKVDFRLIAATNQDLRQMVKEKMFREDLYFRLSVLRINIPPLRDRKDDIELLCRYFLNQYCRKLKLEIPDISPEVLQILYAYTWPGNVRQLENAIIYSVNISRGETILTEHLPLEITEDIMSEKPRLFKEIISPSSNDSNDKLSLEEAEKQAIEAVFLKSDKNVSLTARILGISKTTLYRKLRKYRLQ